MDILNFSVVNWSRAQFALTAMYHWFFVPLTLGLSVMLACMETFYVRTGDEQWKRITRFWMTLFGINFAIGVATGIILEFEFGTNWSNYSWFVGDIFGAPLAIEGLMAFFLESTFMAVMFFGWNKVSRKVHLLSTWLVAIGANLSAWWILVANAWMEHPVGMRFNPATVRNEMQNFWEVAFSPVAVNKFFHTVSSGFVLAAVFVAGISAWYMLRNRERELVRRSLKMAAVFGLVSSVLVVLTGDASARIIARVQPVKFAAMEGLYKGKEGQGLVVFGIPVKNAQGKYDIKYKIEIPAMLSFLAYRDRQAYVAGLEDVIEGKGPDALPVKEKIRRGRIARETLFEYKEARRYGDSLAMDSLMNYMQSPLFAVKYMKYFGYAFLNDPESVIPNVPLAFYSFHVMVFLGFYFVLLFVLALYFLYRHTLEKQRLLLWLMLLSVPLPYLAGECGWVLCETGRQPWIIQDLMPVMAAVSHIDASSVQVTFFLFAFLFTGLLIAEVGIMLKQIKKGPEKEGGN